MNTLGDVGVVIIGRNEGERLRRCLESMPAPMVAVVYVDSGSTDGSVRLAREMNATIVELDMSVPFTAARARNTGCRMLREQHASVRFVQFVDADCTLDAGWLDAAADAMRQDQKLAAVIGHLRERHPESSVYNRLCALEWKSPPGAIDYRHGFGGIAMVRVDVLERVGGYNAGMIAGEDTELGLRLSEAGFALRKLDCEMAIHDAAMTRFGQWWKRAVRSGHAIGQRFDLHGASRLRECVRDRRSVMLFGFVLPILIVALLLPTHGLSLLLLALYAVILLRIYRFRRRWSDSPREARLYAFFCMLGKLPQCLGLIRYQVNRWRNRFELIEYK